MARTTCAPLVVVLGAAVVAAAFQGTGRTAPVTLRHRTIHLTALPRRSRDVPRNRTVANQTTTPHTKYRAYWLQVDPTLLPTDASIRATGLPCSALPHRLHGHTFACLLTPDEARHAAHTLQGLVALGPVHPRHKLDPNAWHPPTKPHHAAAAVHVGVTALLLPSHRVPVRTLADTWRAQFPSCSVRRTGTWSLRVTPLRPVGPVGPVGPASRTLLHLAQRLADTPAVSWLEPYVPPKTHNTYAVPWMMGGGRGDPSVVLADAYDGTGRTVAIADTGCDTNHCAFGTLDVPHTTVVLDVDDPTSLPPAPTLRLDAKIQGYIRYVYDDDVDVVATDFQDGPDGHGTHVCGTCVGHDGAAPGAALIFLDLGTDDDPDVLFVPPDMGHHVVKWLHVHTDVRTLSLSLGTDVNQYTELARQLDESLYQYDDMVVVVAAGNTGTDGVGTVGSPATAKNVVAVGAVYNDPDAYATYRDAVPAVFVDGDVYTDTVAATVSPWVVAGFSSRGPTADGRRKPDVVAPGTPLASARSGTACGRMVRHGTSMAAPLVAGWVARLRTAWPTASAALVKAVLVAWTIPAEAVVTLMEGTDGRIGVGAQRAPATVHDQGFGVARWGDLARTWVADRVVVDPNQTLTWTVEAADTPVQALAGATVVLTWTDPPAALYAYRALVHDVDVEIVGVFPNGTTAVRWYGNADDGDGGNVPDRHNNVERVRVPGNTFHRVEIRVRAVDVHVPQAVAVAVVVEDDSDTANTNDATAWMNPSGPVMGPAVDTCASPDTTTWGLPVACVVRDDAGTVVGGGHRRCDHANTTDAFPPACEVTYCVAPFVWEDTTCRALACGQTVACDVPHGTGIRCVSDPTCVVIRCFSGYTIRDHACFSGSATTTVWQRRWRPNGAALVGLVLVMACLGTYVVGHCRRHHGPVRPVKPPVTTALTRPLLKPASLGAPWHNPLAPLPAAEQRRRVHRLFPRMR